MVGRPLGWGTQAAWGASLRGKTVVLDSAKWFGSQPGRAQQALGSTSGAQEEI